jgi:hypothetical protein
MLNRRETASYRASLRAGTSALNTSFYVPSSITPSPSSSAHTLSGANDPGFPFHDDFFKEEPTQVIKYIPIALLSLSLSLSLSLYIYIYIYIYMGAYDEMKSFI